VQRFAERLQLVGIETNAGAERRLEQSRVRGGDAVPAKCVEVRREQLGLVEAALGDRFPGLAGDNLAIDLPLLKHLKRLPLGIVVDAREANERAFTGTLRRYGVLYEIEALTHPRDLAGFWNSDHGVHFGMRSHSTSVI
jgi:hypothetical protein